MPAGVTLAASLRDYWRHAFEFNYEFLEYRYQTMDELFA